MEDRIRSVGVNQKGYGSIPKMVMLDQELDIKAKAVYAYFCSYTGAGDSCFPSRSKICGDLKISKDSLSKYIKQLADNGYLVTEQVKENGRFSHNVYTLPTEITVSENTGYDNSVSGELDTKKNSIKNNSSLKETEKIYKPKEVRHRYGPYWNVMLTDAQYETLQEEFPLDYDERIERLSEYIESTGKKYKNHLAVIRTWARKDGVKPATANKDNDEAEAFFEELGGGRK